MMKGFRAFENVAVVFDVSFEIRGDSRTGYQKLICMVKMFLLQIVMISVGNSVLR
jgi:hypothetical protein